MYSISQRKHVLNFKYVVSLYVILSFLLRLALLVWSKEYSGLLPFFGIFLTGIVSDLMTLVYIAVPWCLLGIFFPPFKSENVLKKLYLFSTSSLLVMTISLLSFSVVSEITFWNEFSSRFNFIAVDYLVYTNEVLKNIWESYPVFWIVSGVIVFSLGACVYIIRKIKFEKDSGLALKTRAIALGGLVVVVSINWFAGSVSIPNSLTYGEKELSKNGIYSLFSAYFHNELDYDRFYQTKDLKESFQVVRNHLQEDGDLSKDVFSIAREVKANAAFKKYNVVMVSMESMSARYMKAYGSTEDITPNLDALTTKGLFFKNMFSTGTRTVRGLEALVLSIPPTPGQSILRRPKNENLFNIGQYLTDSKYEAEFLYGGYGYFDNMNNFFSTNSFGIWDQAKMDEKEIQFKNAWGVSDEDLYTQAIQRADLINKKGKPFFQLIMTTSNHRPYTYPQKIDIPSGSGRSGAVKYSDFAIGEYLKQAETKPWYNNTIFIFVADHNASVSGNLDVPIVDFRIPFIVYAPNIIKPEVITKLGSQIDVAPTILGLLNASYTSHFFGHDLLHTTSERAFLGTYQKVGMLRDNILTILGPNKTVEQFQIAEGDVQTPYKPLNQDLVNETISYYQTASQLFRTGKMNAAGIDIITNEKK
ncbi:hypothetical protein CIK05_06085 [Bdellovibrio sp. qaytius]|nr:hypothetical protein CIK05_06085 [Bdellovibrio sp. qaytius]